jgi:hypothetical protein
MAFDIERAKLVLSHVIVGAGAVVATLGAVHVLSPDDATKASAAFAQIGDSLTKLVVAVSTLAGIASTVYVTVTNGPLGMLFKGSKAVAASPALTQQVKTASLEAKAPLVTVTDQLPEVAGVGTTATKEGVALANAVPSNTVQPVG